MSQADIAAHNLVGHKLKNNWNVVEKIEPKDGGTGGFFSVCYRVENGEEIAFLKALNFNAFFQMFKGQSIVKILQEQTNAFEFEKDLLLRCRENRLSKVSMIIDEGELFLDGFTIPNVPYLIFEIAEGDIRSNIKFSNNADFAWKIKSLHDVAVGLEQLHKVEISHQDLKPSNVLIYENASTSKIGDLGRSLCANIKAPHDDGFTFTGQINYAPPEFLYKYIHQDWNVRVLSTDMYLFGSLITYYFIGVNMTALLMNNLDIRFRWNVYTGTFDDVKDYLIDAYSKTLIEISTNLGTSDIANNLVEIIKYCCHPIPESRGHKRSFQILGSQFSFTRTISQLDLIRRKSFIKAYNNE